VFSVGYTSHALALVFAAMCVWLLGIQLMRVSLKLLLSYKGWMYENVGAKPSTASQVWLVSLLHFRIFSATLAFFQGILHAISRFQPLMHSFQGALPHLPLPSLKGTMERVDF
jgi:hypothetical protein